MKFLKKYYVKKFINGIDKKIKVKFGKRLECDIERNTIYISFKTDEIDKKTFMDNVRKINNSCNFNDLLLGILHEVGHFYTYEETNEEDYQRSLLILSELYKRKQINATQFNQFYVELPFENLATEWAIDFAMNNKKYCKFFQEKIGNSLTIK